MQVGDIASLTCLNVSRGQAGQASLTHHCLLHCADACWRLGHGSIRLCCVHAHKYELTHNVSHTCTHACVHNGVNTLKAQSVLIQSLHNGNRAATRLGKAVPCRRSITLTLSSTKVTARYDPLCAAAKMQHLACHAIYDYLVVSQPVLQLHTGAPAGLAMYVSRLSV